MSKSIRYSDRAHKGLNAFLKTLICYLALSPEFLVTALVLV